MRLAEKQGEGPSDIEPEKLKLNLVKQEVEAGNSDKSIGWMYVILSWESAAGIQPHAKLAVTVRHHVKAQSELMSERRKK